MEPNGDFLFRAVLEWCREQGTKVVRWAGAKDKVDGCGTVHVGVAGIGWLKLSSNGRRRCTVDLRGSVLARYYSSTGAVTKNKDLYRGSTCAYRLQEVAK
jgi:hypothetical protein